MWLDRLTAFLDGDEPGTRLSKIRAFELIFIAILVTEYWARAIPQWSTLGRDDFAGLAIGTALCLAALRPAWRRAAFAGLVLSHGWLVWHEFPRVGNHGYLELLLCGLVAFLDPREEGERVLYLRSVRWLTFVVLFYSGLQKVAYGYWFHGQQLAYSLWIESFRPIVALLVSAGDFARLTGYTRQIGDGPYLASGPLLAIVSNTVWITELSAALLLLVRRARTVAVIASIAVIAAIEAGARELFFGMVFTNAILLFLPTDSNRRLVPVFAVVLVALLLSRIGVLPQMTFY